MLVAALVLGLASVQADRQDPLAALAELLTAHSSEAEKLAAVRGKLDALGDDLFHPDEKARRADRRESLAKEYPAPKILGFHFEDRKFVEPKLLPARGSARQVMRLEVVDPKTGKKRVESKMERVQFTFIKDENRWLIQSMVFPCRMCEGSGLCFSCEGKGSEGGAPCRGCAGKQACAVCKGKKERDEVVPEFRFWLLSEQKIEYAPDLSTPEKAAQAFADYLAKRAVEESHAEMESQRAFLAKYRACVAPEIAKAVDDSFARAVADAKERFRTKRPKVESLEKKVGTAMAIIREPVPPGLEMLNFKDFDHRIHLKQVGDRWMVEKDQMGCACAGKDAACISCKGSGWIDR
jgi:hypothetical protein